MSRKIEAVELTAIAIFLIAGCGHQVAARRAPAERPTKPPASPKPHFANDVEIAKADSFKPRKEGDHLVLGKLGQALDTVFIYTKPDLKSPVFYRTRKYQYLVVGSAEQNGFFPVLMSNEKLGYIARDKVAALPYTVTADGSAESRNSQGGTPTPTSATEYALNAVGVENHLQDIDLSNGISSGEFVRRVKAFAGVNLPQAPRLQVNHGTPVNRLEELKPGDRLYFWTKDADDITMAGIYVGNGYMALSPAEGGYPKLAYIGSRKWRSLLVAARRDKPAA